MDWLLLGMPRGAGKKPRRGGRERSAESKGAPAPPLASPGDTLECKAARGAGPSWWDDAPLLIKILVQLTMPATGRRTKLRHPGKMLGLVEPLSVEQWIDLVCQVLLTLVVSLYLSASLKQGRLSPVRAPHCTLFLSAGLALLYLWPKVERLAAANSRNICAFLFYIKASLVFDRGRGILLDVIRTQESAQLTTHGDEHTVLATHTLVTMTLIQYDVFLCSIVLSSACELLTTLTCNPERWIGPGTSCLFSGDLFKQHFTHHGHPRASVLLALAAISCLHDVSGVCLHDVRGVGDHCCKTWILGLMLYAFINAMSLWAVLLLTLGIFRTIRPLSNARSSVAASSAPGDAAESPSTGANLALLAPLRFPRSQLRAAGMCVWGSGIVVIVVCAVCGLALRSSSSGISADAYSVPVITATVHAVTGFLWLVLVRASYASCERTAPSGRKTGEGEGLIALNILNAAASCALLRLAEMVLRGVLRFSLSVGLPPWWPALMNLMATLIVSRMRATALDAAPSCLGELDKDGTRNKRQGGNVPAAVESRRGSLSDCGLALETQSEHIALAEQDWARLSVQSASHSVSPSKSSEAPTRHVSHQEADTAMIATNVADHGQAEVTEAWQASECQRNYERGANELGRAAELLSRELRHRIVASDRMLSVEEGEQQAVNRDAGARMMDEKELLLQHSAAIARENRYWNPQEGSGQFDQSDLVTKCLAALDDGADGNAEHLTSQIACSIEALLDDGASDGASPPDSSIYQAPNTDDYEQEVLVDHDARALPSLRRNSYPLGAFQVSATTARLRTERHLQNDSPRELVAGEAMRASISGRALPPASQALLAEAAHDLSMGLSMQTGRLPAQEWEMTKPVHQHGDLDRSLGALPQAHDSRMLEIDLRRRAAESEFLRQRQLAFLAQQAGAQDQAHGPIMRNSPMFTCLPHAESESTDSDHPFTHLGAREDVQEGGWSAENVTEELGEDRGEWDMPTGVGDLQDLAREARRVRDQGWV